MHRTRFSNNFAIFVLFFGVAMLDAFRDHDFLKSIFWILIGLVFLLADNKKQQANPGNDV
jgi:hypothetical protein